MARRARPTLETINLGGSRKRIQIPGASRSIGAAIPRQSLERHAERLELFRGATPLRRQCRAAVFAAAFVQPDFAIGVHRKPAAAESARPVPAQNRLLQILEMSRRRRRRAAHRGKSKEEHCEYRTWS